MPAIPPSPIQTQERSSFKDSFKLLYNNKDYVKLLSAFSVDLANHLVFISSVHHIMKPFGYTNGQIGTIAALVNTSSVLGKFGFGIIANKYATFKNTLKAIYLITFVTMFIFLVLITLQNTGFIYVSAFLYGLFYNSQWAPALEFSAEVAYPVAEANANGIL